MDKAFLEQLKQKLHDEEQRLIGELSDAKSPSDDEGESKFQQYGSKEDENAAEVATFTTTVSVNSSLEKMLADVRSALKRIEDGAYGMCKYCKQPIPEKRLLIRPESSSCISCKEKLKRSA